MFLKLALQKDYGPAVYILSFSLSIKSVLNSLLDKLNMLLVLGGTMSYLYKCHLLKNPIEDSLPG